MTGTRERRAPLPPRWFVRAFWSAHRALVAATGERRGLWPARPGKWGALRLTTVGRRSGREHPVVLGYLEDGANLVTLAMNGWAAPDPAWWLNLQAHPRARVRLRDTAREIVARAAEGAERDRLWERWRSVDRNLDGFAARRGRPTAVVVLEPADPDG